MPDINNSLAMQVSSNPIDLKGTLGTLSQIQLAQAHAGLYGLQAQQEARKLSGLEYLKTNPTDYMGAIQRGLDPSVGSTLQTMGEKEKQYQVGGGLSAESTSQFSSAAKNRAETTKIGTEVDTKAMENKGRIAQGYLSNPTDETWQSGITAAANNGYVDKLNAQRLLAVKDPAQRQEMAKAWVGQGVSPSEYTAPHTVEPTAGVTSRAAMLAPGANAPAATNRPGGPLPSSAAMLGDDEAVRKGLYTPTPEQIRRGVTGPAAQGGVGTIPPAMSPGQKAESTAYGEGMAKVLPVLADKADQSRQSNFTLDQMRQESQSWNMGKGGAALMEAARYTKSALASFGIDSSSLDKSVGDFESFQKNTGTLVRQAVKEVSSRAAVQEFTLIQNQLPSADMSRRGFNQIADQFQSVNDFNIAKHQAGQAWRDATGSMDKFEAEWNKSITPAAFLVARLPPEQLGALKANMDRTPDGRSTLKSITKQLQWAHDHNLDQLVK